MKRPYAVLILALAGWLGCPAARAQQTQPASGGAPDGAAAPAAATPADPLKDPECQRRFEAAFGPEAIKVDMSASKEDDADFAGKLAAAADQAAPDTGFQVYLYDKVCIFGLRAPRTCGLVGQTLAKLDTFAPRHRPFWEDYRLELARQSYRQARTADRAALGEDLIVELILVGDLRAEGGKWDEAAELYQQAFQTASGLKSGQKEAAAEKLNQANRVKEVQALRRRLETNPGDAKLRMSIIDAYLGVLDDPGGAADLLNAEVGEAYRTYVPLAARLPGDLASGVLMELGNWYKALARQAPPPTRPTLGRRVKGYYLACIRKLRLEGATISAVQEAVAKINASLVEIGLEKLPEKPVFRDLVVQKSLERAMKWLWHVQAADGCWVKEKVSDSHDYGAFNTFPTAAVLAALIGGGASLEDARAVKALRWLEPTATRQTNGVAFRCLVWMEVQKRKPGPAGQLLAKDVSTLILGTRDGSYGETVTSRALTSLLRSWQGPVGVDAGQQLGLKVQPGYWQMVAGYWASQQRADGSMGLRPPAGSRKRPSPRHTIIGAGSLAIALGWLHGPEAVRNAAGAQTGPLARALSWLDKNFTAPDDLAPDASFAPRAADGTPDHLIYADAVYMLSRLGLATGRDKLGQVNWWTDGSRYLAGLQRPDGSWGNIIDSALAVHFLINGYKFEQTYLGALPALPPRPASRPATTQEAGHPLTELAAAQAAQRLQERESNLKYALRTNPQDRSVAQRLVRLYVLELREPQKALQYADQTGDFLIKRYIRLLDKDMSVLYPGELLGMGDWHMALADGAPDAGRKLALGRAVAYYQSYLARKPAIAADAAKAIASLEEARDALSAMDGN